jgi:putative FmdB family regulatory protein
MPLYQYQCTCGAQFRKRVSLAKKELPQVCGLCGSDVMRDSYSAPSFSAKAETQTIPTPTNTGMTSLDMEVDRVIAQDSAEKWKLINRRQRAKHEVLRENPDAVGTDLVRNAEGTYELMDSSYRELQKVRREKSREIGAAIQADVERRSQDNA